MKIHLEIENNKQMQQMNQMVLLLDYICMFASLIASIFGFETSSYAWILYCLKIPLWQVNKDLTRVRYLAIFLAQLTEINYFYHLLQANEIDSFLFLAGFGIYNFCQYVKESIAKDPIQIVMLWLTHYFLWISVIYYSRIGPKITVRDVFLIFAVGFAWAYVKYQ